MCWRGSKRRRKLPSLPMVKCFCAKRRKPILVSAHASPLVHALFVHINKRKYSVTQLARLAGPRKEVIYRWAKGQTPRLGDIEAVAQVLELRIYLGDSHDNDR